MSGEVLGGAAQGAAAGAVAGPIGMVVGGIVGAIGGLFSSKSNKAKKKARKEQIIMSEREAGIQRRDLVRQFRMARAQALASGSSQEGGGESSAVLGALGGIASQGRGNLKFFDTQIGSQRKVNKLLKKADKYDGYAASTGALLSLGVALMDMPGVGSKKSTDPTSASVNFRTGFSQINSLESSFNRALSNGWDPDVPSPILGQ